MHWLIDASLLSIPPLPDLPSVVQPILQSRPAPIHDNHEPMQLVAGRLPVLPVYSWLGFRHCPRELRVRAGVLRRLERAQGNLPADFSLVVLDGWRSRQFQQELIEYYEKLLGRSVSGFVADADVAVVPPHTTGGAVDLTLSWRGASLGLGTDYDAFISDAAPEALEREPGRKPARDLRRLLAAVLTREGFVVNPFEWWHWSFGDQAWARTTAASAAVYGEQMRASD
jgi:zinc D-Ala-D-Ala dipeptidase